MAGVSFKKMLAFYESVAERLKPIRHLMAIVGLLLFGFTVSGAAFQFGKKPGFLIVTGMLWVCGLTLVAYLYSKKHHVNKNGQWVDASPIAESHGAMRAFHLFGTTIWFALLGLFTVRAIAW